MVTDPRTNTPINTQTHRQDRLQYAAPQLASMQCKHMCNRGLQWAGVDGVPVGNLRFTSVQYVNPTGLWLQSRRRHTSLDWDRLHVCCLMVVC